MGNAAVMLKRCHECGSANEPADERCDACGHDGFSAPEEAATELDCCHCGADAVESPSGIFHEDMASKCASCGHPGAVHVEDGCAYFTPSDEWHVRCESDDCHDCHSLDRDEVEYLRELVVATLPILEGSEADGAKKLWAEILDRYGFMYAGKGG